MRLIDADALIDKAETVLDEHETIWFDAVSVNNINSAPTIEPKAKVIAQVAFDEDKLREIVHEAVERIKEEYDIVDNPDAVSVVRCKECKYASDSEYTHCSYVTWYNGEDDFCSRGEREGER